MDFGATAVESRPCLETVRALHQTVVALRAALEQSRSEILELKQRAWPVESVEEALRNLSIENHVLRNSILHKSGDHEKNTSKDAVEEEESKEQYKKNVEVVAPIELEGKSPKKHVKIVTPLRELFSPNQSISKDSINEIETSPICSPKKFIDEENNSKYEVEHSPQISSPIISVNVSPRESLHEIKNSSITKPKTCDRSLIEISIAIENLGSRTISKSLENLTVSKKGVPGKKLGKLKTLSFTNIPSTVEEESRTDSDMSENFQKGLEESSPRRHISSLSDTFSPRHTSSPRHNVLPSHTQSSPLNVSSSPNISFTQVTANTFQNLISHSQTLENAQSEPVLQNTSQNDLEQNEEVDDIELIFTTEETNDSDFKEELVPIETGDGLQQETHHSKNLHCPVSDFDQSLSDRELEDDVFNETDNQENSSAQSHPYRRENSQLYNSKSDNSINHEEKSLKSYYSYQDSSFENKSLEKDESFDRFEERVRIIETDISKCGIIDVEYLTGRRNTCPNPLPYRPIIHREAIGKGLNTRKGRPILSHSSNTRRESGAQTDISALPSSSWRSESSLAHKVKVGENFTTLPSKFPLPGSRLRLSEKTSVEARRVLLSDIGFTSMVPELSRSADHLCPGNIKTPMPTSYGQFLRTPDLYSPGFASQKFTWTATTASPSEVSQLHSRFSSTYPLSSPPIPSRRFSAPVSPSRRVMIRPTTSKVSFANGSLPELRSDWGTTVDSGDSTDSLVDEAENYLRRSIDCIVTGGDVIYRREPKTRSFRRASAPEPSGDNIPPQDWHPFLPRTPRDLHLDHWVKVIVPEGKVRGGRVRYVGILLNQTEQYVGVQLSTPDGHSDGTHNNRRYFTCEPYHGIFVPFKKVVMGWRP